MKILALDLETTGLSPDYDYITQIAVAIMEGGEVLDAFHTRVCPDLERFRLTTGALSAQCGDFAKDPVKVANWLTGLFDAPPPMKAWELLIKWADGKETYKLPTVAHNMIFDAGFIHKRVEIFRKMFLPNPVFGPVWIDTLKMAQLADPGKQSYKLDALVARLDLGERPAEHDAMQDAILAGQLHHKLTKL